MSTIRLIRWPSLARLVAAGVIALLIVLSLPRLLRSPEPPPVPADVGLPRASALTVAPTHRDPVRKPAKRAPREPRPQPGKETHAPKPQPKPQPTAPAPEPVASAQPVSSPETASAVAYSPATAPALPAAPPPSPSPPASSASVPPEFGFEH